MSRSESENPYAAPASTCIEAADVRCSYCGRPGREVGSLVQSPGGTSYICGGCAKMACELVEYRQRPLVERLAGPVFVMSALGLSLCLLVWDAFLSLEPHVTRLASVPVMMILAVALVVSGLVAVQVLRR